MLLYPLSVLVLGLVATPVAIAALRRAAVLDVPNQRSSHTQPTVRGAGIGVALVTAGVAVAAATDLAAGVGLVGLVALLFAAVGFADDIRDLSVRQRLLIQSVLAAAAVAITLEARPLLAVLAVIGVVGYLNAFNFMDGINGISGLHALAIGATWIAAGTLQGAPAATLLGGMLAAAAVAFLPFNYPSARAFLGDVGSYFFGGWIAVSAVVLYGHLPLVVIVLPLTTYGADTAWTLVRRIRSGQTWHEAHREHVYQRLVHAGWSHTTSAALHGALTLLCGGLALIGAFVIGGRVGSIVAVTLVAVPLVGYLLLPTALERRGGAGVGPS